MILEEILEQKRKIISRQKKIIPPEKLHPKFLGHRTRSLRENLEKKGFGIIAELKRGSPSAGMIDENLNIKEKALIYQKSGVSGISVLTCEPYFLGSMDDLVNVRETVDLPLLMKDFIFDPYQILQARVFGADAVLLILRILSDDEFLQLSAVAESYAMEIVVEIHTKRELERALRLVNDWDGRILGINNRNLDTLEINLGVTLDLIKFVPQDKIIAISESGITDRTDVQALKESGLKGILVGESILKNSDASRKIEELMK